MALPQRLSFVTLGARSVGALRRFYAAWGWTENDGGTDEYASFGAGSVSLALFPIGHLTAEAAPAARLPEPGGWHGFTLAVNVASPAEVDRAVADAVAAGAVLVAGPVERAWGGYSGYVADPEGNRWELAWAPGPDPA